MPGKAIPEIQDPPGRPGLGVKEGGATGRRPRSTAERRSPGPRSSLSWRASCWGELNDGQSAQINIQILAPVILEALTPFPEARQAVAGRLQELESEPSS